MKFQLFLKVRVFKELWWDLSCGAGGHFTVFSATTLKLVNLKDAHRGVLLWHGAVCFAFLATPPSRVGPKQSLS